MSNLGPGLAHKKFTQSSVIKTLFGAGGPFAGATALQAAAKSVQLAIEVAPVRVLYGTLDASGDTVVSTTTGILLPIGSIVTVQGAENIRTLQIIASAADATVQATLLGETGV